MPVPNSRSRCPVASPSTRSRAQATPVNKALADAAAAVQVAASIAAFASRSGRTRQIGQGERQAKANSTQAGASTAALCSQGVPPDVHIRYVSKATIGIQ